MANDSNNSQEELDLSSLNFTPTWARDEPKKKKDYSGYEPKEPRPDRKRRNDRGRPDGNRPPFKKVGGRRDNNFRGDNRRPVETPIPEGFTGEIMPIEEGLDRLAKQILHTARTYSVFDLARMVLQSRERFNVGLRAPEGTKVFRNTVTSATFLTKEEAISNFWISEAKEKYYAEITKEVEAPAGNFTSVAKCSKSGVYIGPPNHHSYQQKLHALHRERFSHLPFEYFQKQIIVEREEEAIEAWKEAEKKQTFYVDRAELPEQKTPKTTKEEPTQAEEVVAEVTEDTQAPEVETAETSEVANETPEAEVENTAEVAETETPAEESAPTEEIPEALLIKSRTELEQHFSQKYFNRLYKKVQISWVPSSISRKHLSPALLTLLKDAISQEKRYPGKLASLMCRQLSGRNVAVYKSQKKLLAGPSRPHVIPALDSLSERPKALLEWSLQNDGKTIEELWAAVLPENVSEDEKANWFHDLKWLLSQGYSSLNEDGTVTFSKKVETQPKKSKTDSPKKEAPAKKQDTPEVKEEVEPSPNSETPAPATEEIKEPVEENNPQPSAEVNTEDTSVTPEFPEKAEEPSSNEAEESQ